LRPRNLAYTSPTRQLYSGLSTDFIRDSVHNRIGEMVKDAFARFPVAQDAEDRC
jgi:hypothetical protein